MILKYKLENGSWRYITLTDFFISELDISDIVYKYTDKGIKKLDLTTDVYNNKALKEILTKTHETFSCNLRLLTEELKCSTKYILVAYGDYNKGKGEYDGIIVNNEAYLMSDSGKTIEKLM